MPDDDSRAVSARLQEALGAEPGAPAAQAQAPASPAGVVHLTVLTGLTACIALHVESIDDDLPAAQSRL